MSVKYEYYGKLVEVSSEVADFLEADRKRMANQGRSDRRHISFISFDWLFIEKIKRGSPTEDKVIRKIEKEELRYCISFLNIEDQHLIHMIYFHGISQVEMSRRLGVSPAAISKKLSKIKRILKDSILNGVEFFKLILFFWLISLL